MLALSRAAYESILDHARADQPLEACGVLVGTREDGERHVETVRRVPNVADAPRVRYELDPEATMAVFDEAEATGREVVGFYHSHPTGPSRPSVTDREQAAWPEKVYVVASLAARPPTLDAWLWTGEDFEDVAVAVR
ncbi:desampylase [Halobacterium litoreum]|uniref:Desampylase n=1 Tax=Halobacterium litoreum TaxID=2039234 RepID=A0ABD5NEG7_9EURY|nr:desampylase [Halobacterium litoreum]UHH13847.1 M67 family metallopeptidase [Halobacterium litoreum]